LEYSKIYIFWHEHLKFQYLFYKYVLKLSLYHIKFKKLFKQSWKYYESIELDVFSIAHEYAVKVINFSQCVSLIELNAWEDE